MVDLGIELVGAEQRPPSLEDGVGNFENPYVDFRIGGGEAADEFLMSWSLSSAYMCVFVVNYLGQCVPSLPKVRVGDDRDGLAELGLEGRGRRYHQPNKLLLDRLHLILGYLVVSFFILQATDSSAELATQQGQFDGPHS